MPGNRRITLARRPEGLPTEDCFASDEVDLPELAEGEALIRVSHLSIDPTLRTWISEARSYFPPVAIGEVVRCAGAGEVVATNCDAYAVGDLVTTLPGWQQYAIVRDDVFTTKVPVGVEPIDVLGALGQNGISAYVGLVDIGKAKAGETVVVSAAAGATGSVVGQIAKIKGARVVGIAGGPEKCAWLVDELGFDAAIDYKDGPVGPRLRELCPDGIDVYFDNVGGEILDAALANLALKARVVLCGAISIYTQEGRPTGVANTFSLITRRARMEGFLVLDYLDRFLEAQVDLFTWVAEGRVKHAEHVVDGLEQAPDALNLLFTGGNTGKVIVAV